ncbi:MAG: DUF86 domain-containing protein [Deltaproteobacteria bacterium]|nr:DUF86 domain-containing protein [Deltaproteobacteria bacterium]
MVARPVADRLLLKMASFRNLFVHAYGTIDDALVLGVVQRRLGDLEQFAAAILRYLDR